MTALHHLLKTMLTLFHLRCEDLGDDTEQEGQDDHAADGHQDTQEAASRRDLLLGWRSRGPNEDAPERVRGRLTDKRGVDNRSEYDQCHGQEDQHKARSALVCGKPIGEAVLQIVPERVLAACNELVVLIPLLLNDGQRPAHEKAEDDEDKGTTDVMKRPTSDVEFARLRWLACAASILTLLGGALRAQQILTCQLRERRAEAPQLAGTERLLGASRFIGRADRARARQHGGQKHQQKHFHHRPSIRGRPVTISMWPRVHG
mmetsp:Transcript_19272/g.53830  ORF Transcript_19272/g.53830 Transcript_19272/m.53830 type:complete len:261 (+) Transcript_19272:2011-2793(+)